MGPELSEAGRPVMHLAATGHRGQRAAGQTSDETRGRGGIDPARPGLPSCRTA
jgi:hypothetical protein